MPRPKKNIEHDNGKSAKVDLKEGHGSFSFPNPARIYAAPKEGRCLDLTELARLEEEFRFWARTSRREDVRLSRKRILLIFLIIRYTGARLNEVLRLDFPNCLDVSQNVIRFNYSGENLPEREVQISGELMSEILEVLADPMFLEKSGFLLKVDPGHVRRKFYQRAAACGFSQELGSPNAIRRARAVELMQKNVPLPVVQRILGHSSPNLTASLVSFSPDDIYQAAKYFIERESQWKTSARNSFFGKIGSIQTGDIQSLIELITPSGDTVTTVITNTSLRKLGLKTGSLIVAEIKAPLLMVQKSSEKPSCSAENIFLGTLKKIIKGKLVSEFIVQIHDGTELCSIVSEVSRRKLALCEGDDVWVMFNSSAVVLHVD